MVVSSWGNDMSATNTLCQIHMKASTHGPFEEDSSQYMSPLSGCTLKPVLTRSSYRVEAVRTGVGFSCFAPPLALIEHTVPVDDVNPA